MLVHKYIGLVCSSDDDGPILGAPGTTREVVEALLGPGAPDAEIPPAQQSHVGRCWRPERLRKVQAEDEGMLELRERVQQTLLRGKF